MGMAMEAVCAGSVMRSVLTSLCSLRGSLEGMAADRRDGQAQVPQLPSAFAT